MTPTRCNAPAMTPSNYKTQRPLLLRYNAPNMSKEPKCNACKALALYKGNVKRTQLVNLMRITQSVAGKQ